jgi:uncharacterized cupredoxin-like copper-binding protein
VFRRLTSEEQKPTTATAGEVSLAPGAEAETTYVFGTPGRLAFACHLPGHWAYGMHSTIDVAA